MLERVLTMKTWELISIVCSALMAGMFYGPWAALSRSMRTFTPEVFLAIVDRMNRNMAPVMTVLMPATLMAMIPVLLGSFRTHPQIFSFYGAAFVLFLVATAVTVLVELPLVNEMVSWKAASLPANWQQVRDRWVRFHVIRVVAGMVSLLLLLIAVIL
jgi:uncharacterized membrane protein